MKAEYGMSVQVSENVWRKAAITLDGDAGETPDQLLNRARKVVEDWFSSPDPYATPSKSPIQQEPPREIKVEKIPEEERVRKLIEDLNTCISLKVLESYKLIAKLNPSVQAAYDMKYKELTENNNNA